MRVFKYWVRYNKKIPISGNSHAIKLFGGSNISEVEAEKDAEKRAIGLAERINLGYRKDKEYEADILEEIIEEIDENNIVTRNRYGALVLNSKNLLFIDIDSYKLTFSNFFFRKNLENKEKMFLDIERMIGKKKYARHSFRLYETRKGYRLLVPHKNYVPRSKETKEIMRDFGADRFYYRFCLKQNCFRARLTPKPFRIKQKTPKIIFPDRDTKEEIAHSNWVAEYDKKSEDYATCKLIKTYGRPVYSRAISYHDRETKINYELKLG